jgi:hypothetical protein
MRAMDGDRDRRWPSTTAFAQALEVAVTATPSRSLRWVRRGVGAVGALALLAYAGGATVLDSRHRGWVRVADANGVLSLAVPAGWAGQLRDSGWNVAAVGLPAGTEPGLQVAADLASETSPGVFAGMSRWLVPNSRVTAPPHPGCTRMPDRAVAAAGLTGQVQHWTGCGGGAVSYSEVVLTRAGDQGVFLQIRQNSADPDRTDDVLRTLWQVQP